MLSNIVTRNGITQTIDEAALVGRNKRILKDIYNTAKWPSTI